MKKNFLLPSPSFSSSSNSLIVMSAFQRQDTDCNRALVSTFSILLCQMPPQQLPLQSWFGKKNPSLLLIRYEATCLAFAEALI